MVTIEYWYNGMPSNLSGAINEVIRNTAAQTEGTVDEDADHDSTLVRFTDKLACADFLSRLADLHICRLSVFCSTEQEFDHLSDWHWGNMVYNPQGRSKHSLQAEARERRLDAITEALETSEGLMPSNRHQ